MSPQQHRRFGAGYPLYNSCLYEHRVKPPTGACSRRISESLWHRSKSAPAHTRPFGISPRNITLIVPYGAGGGTDITARMLAKDLEPALNTLVTVENRAGGGGWVGWGALANAKSDAYTIGYLNVPSMYAGYLDPQYKRTETLSSFTPLMNHVLDYSVWAVKMVSPFKNVKDVIEVAQKNTDQITVSAFGAGSDDHLAILAIVSENKIKLITVHHRSTAEAKTQVLGGHLHVLGANISEVAEEAKAGTLRILGVMAPERSHFLPNAPTFREQGYNQVWSVSRGIAAPASLPQGGRSGAHGRAGESPAVQGAPAEGRGT